jgi:hypothetical protein
VLRPRGELAVQEDRHAELLPDHRRRGERLGGRRPAPLLVEIDHRHHVQGAHVRMDARVGADVDARDHRARAAQERLRELPLPRGEREHRAVVIGVGVEIEKARRRKRPPDSLQRREITTLADIGNGHE